MRRGRPEDDVLMADHRTLRRACGPGCVDEDGDVARLRPGDLGLEVGGMGGQVIPPQRIEVVDEDDPFVGKPVQSLLIVDDDLGEAGHLFADRQIFVELLVILHEQKAGVAIVHQIGELRGGVGRVDAGHDRADALCADIGVEPFLAVFRQDRNHVAAAEPQRYQPKADKPGVIPIVFPAIGPPDAELLLPMRDPARPFAAALGEQLYGGICAIDEKRAGRQILIHGHPMKTDLLRHCARGGAGQIFQLVHRHVFRCFQRR